MKADYFPGAGGVGSLRLRPLFVPSIANCGPFTAAQVVLDQIDLPTSCPPLSLSLSIPADDEAYALIHGGASSTSPSTSLRPKLLPFWVLGLGLWALPAFSLVFGPRGGYLCAFY